MTARGLPHSEISGSTLVSSSPELIAACCVLHRLCCQGIHLCALSYFNVRTLTDFGIRKSIHCLFFEIASARTRKYANGPLFMF